MAFCDPLFSLDEQNRRTVILENWNELELDAEADCELDDEPPAPLLDWLELLLDDWDEEPEDFCSVIIKPLIPFPPAHSKFRLPAWL